MKKPAHTPLKSAPAALTATSGKKKKPHASAPHPANNAALNAQNRRVLAQHYRAKYGVK
jgi:hypothetical protein